MKTFRNIALGILISTAIVIIGCVMIYNYNLSPVGKSQEKIDIEIPNNSTSRQIAKILKDNKLIRDERIFLIYLKLNNKSNLKAGYYEFSKSLGVKEIVKLLEDGSKKNPNEIRLTFKEGINMRQIAKIISENTNNSYDSVIAKSNDVDYLNTVIENYWFVNNDILNDEIYYKLEGYLYPDTYHFDNKDVTVEEIFNKMLDQMGKVLGDMKEDIDNNSMSIHEILTLASMVEKEASREQDRSGVASVFVNRLRMEMSLGSDVTTRYAVKEDNNKKALTKEQFATKSPYNTRLTDGSMNGKLPIGPISTVSLSSIKAAINPDVTDNIYFISNIKTLETFFYSNASDFEKKKAELRSVNGGL